jgi:anthranilate phosphoribosyltransferase
VLDGGRGPVRDTVLLNAAAGIAAYDARPGAVPERLGEALVRASDAVDSGAARAKLAEWVAAVQSI